MKYVLLLLLIISCSSKKNINNYIDKKTYTKDFKLELYKRCLFQNSYGMFHNNIAKDLYGDFPPPPPYYIRPSKELIDSISKPKIQKKNILEKCYNLTQNVEIIKIINNEYRHQTLVEKIE